MRRWAMVVTLLAVVLACAQASAQGGEPAPLANPERAPPCPPGAYCERAGLGPPEQLAAAVAEEEGDAPRETHPAPSERSPELTEEELIAALRSPRPSSMDPTGAWSSDHERRSHGMSAGEAMLTVGAVAFGLSYILPLVVVSVWGEVNPDLDPGWGWTALPIAGPFVANGAVDPGHAGSVLLIMDGVVQTAGAALSVVGGTALALEDDDSYAATLTVLPMVAAPATGGSGAGVHGVTVVGRF